MKWTQKHKFIAILFQGSASTNGAVRTTSELERTKINQESLFRRIRISYTLHGVLNFVLIIVYISLVEVYLLDHTSWVGPESPTVDVLEMIKDRRVLYTPAIILMLLTTAFFGWHLQQVQRCRDDARANYNQTRRYKEGDESGLATTSNGSTAHSSIVRNQRAPTFVPSAPPPTYEQPLLPPPEEKNHSLQPVPPATAPYQEHDSPMNNLGQQVESEYGSGTIYHQRQRHGTYKFHEEGCVTCEVIHEGKSFRSKMTGKNYMFMSSVSCMDENCIYLVSWNSVIYIYIYIYILQ